MKFFSHKKIEPGLRFRPGKHELERTGMEAALPPVETDRMLPGSVDSERAVLGAVLLDA